MQFVGLKKWCKEWRPLPILALLVTAGALVSCVQMPVQDVDSGISASFTEGISGRRPTPIAQPGQILPLQPTRRIQFKTSQGTSLSLDVSPDGTGIVFDMLGDIYRLPISGGRAEHLSMGMAFDSQPVYSPDGRSILFLSDRSGAENLWLMDADGAHPRQLSLYDNDTIFISPEWAPDGNSILVSRFWSDRNGYELWRFKPVPGDMGEVVRATTADGSGSRNSLGHRFSPDGQVIYLATLDDDDPAFAELSAWQIIRRDLKTGEETVILPATTDGDSISPRFRPVASPDGNNLVFAERKQGQTWLKLLDLQTGEISVLTNLDPDLLQASLWHDAIPRYDFTPSGDAIIINRYGLIQRISLKTGEAETIQFTAEIDQQLGRLVRYQADAEDGPVRARLIQAPHLAPDETKLAFSALGRIYTQSLASGAQPQLLRQDDVTGYQPSWSPDGESIAYTSWTRTDGGDIWVSSADGGTHRKITSESAFYTHPVFIPQGDALIVVRSSVQKRRETYMEFGQLREAELVYIPLSGGPARVLLSGNIGGTPHFRSNTNEVLINLEDGVHTVSLTGDGDTLVTQAVGPGWYFASGSASADDLRVSPDGKWALAQIAQQLHLYELNGRAGETVDLANPDVLHVQLTDIGADFFGWSGDGTHLNWSVGSTYYRLPLSEIVFDRGRNESVASRVDMIVMVDRATPKGQVLLRGGNILAFTDRAHPGQMLKNFDILITDNRITDISPSGTIAADASVHVVDVSGKYIMPGLIDAHYHVADIRREVLDFDAWGLKIGLAYGTTTLFDPSSLTIDMLAYQDLIDTGDVVGARLYTTGPALFDYNDFRSKAEVMSVLRRYRDHYRLSNLKLYRSGNRRVRQWIAEAANELGMTVTTEGALSFKLDLTQIIDGFSGVEHALPPAVHYRDVTEFFARSGTSNTPTLVITHGGFPASDVFIQASKPFDDEKYARFAPEWFRESRFQGISTRNPEDYFYPAVANSALKLFQSGGLVSLGAHGDIPGLGTHWELQAYVEGGWQPAEALWAATMGSATAISRDESLGSLEIGKLADLIILDANPLDDIKNTLAIRYVMKNGRLYDDETLEEVSFEGTPSR